MSIINNIKLGVLDKRSKFNLSQDTHMTANVGACIPSFCREMVPNSHFTVSVDSQVRLSQMNVPTQGRLGLRHYHTFVPYNSIFFPFDAFIAQEAYTYSDGNAAIPSNTFKVQLKSIINYLIVNHCYCTVVTGQSLGSADDYRPMVIDDIIKNLRAVIRNRVSLSSTLIDDLGMHFYQFEGSNGGLILQEAASDKRFIVSSDEIVDSKNCDFLIYLGSTGNEDAFIACKLKYTGKLIRSILVGLGYNLTPFTNAYINPFKIIAFFKSYYSLFMNSRTKNYFQTNAYKFTAYLNSSASLLVEDVQLKLQYVLRDLAHCYFNLPADYFSSSNINISSGNHTISTAVQTNPNLAEVPVSWSQLDTPSSGDDSALTQRLAQYALKHINKHSVVGKSIHDWLVAEYGVSSAHDDIHEDVVKLGASKVHIQISDVMSTAETEDAKLGEYAGRGIGFGKSEKFSYDAKTFGCWITISVIVPDNPTSYYQGILRENLALTHYDFFTPDFDAIGYQTLGQLELSVDYTREGNSTGVQSAAIGSYLNESFGLSPRYTHYKVGRDVVNGDISLPSTRDAMSCYHLDRELLPYRTWTASGMPVSLLRLTNDESFRKIGDGDSYGNYQRIFGYTGIDYDHFIIQSNISCDAMLPMSPISESYDTFEDSHHTVEFNHV